MTKAEIITIGDELLIGQVINTNQAFIAERLNEIGILVERMTTVGDDLDGIVRSFADAWNRCDVVMTTGGLGPTHDDITKKGVCAFFGCDLVSNDDLRTHIRELLRKRNVAWTNAHEEQTLIPRKAILIPNPVGTAAGYLFEQENKYFMVFPGVPYEMKEMMQTTAIPFLASKVRPSVISHRTLRTTGVPESYLAQQLGDLEPMLHGAKLAFLPSPTGVRLRITVQESDAAAAHRRVAEVEARIREKIQKHIYGTDDEELEDVLGVLLSDRKLTIAVAESCTGGLIANRLTNVSGSSRYFDRGIVAYSNRSKVEILGVPDGLLAAHGAVSKEVAEAMAAGVRRMARTDIGLSTTGVAGPTGGTQEKPVGLVWIGYSDVNTTFAIRTQFGDQRIRVKERASQAALELVRRRLLSTDEPDTGTRS